MKGLDVCNKKISLFTEMMCRIKIWTKCLLNKNNIESLFDKVSRTTLSNFKDDVDVSPIVVAVMLIVLFFSLRLQK